MSFSGFSDNTYEIYLNSEFDKLDNDNWHRSIANEDVRRD